MGLAFAGSLCGASGQAPSSDPEESTVKRLLSPLMATPEPLPPVPSVLPSADRVWTMEQALARALEANPDVQVALAGINRQDGVRLQTAALLYPRLGVSASVERRAESLIDRSPEEFDRIPSLRTALAESSYDSRIELRQVVFDGLSGWNQVKRAALLKKQAAVDAREIYLRVAAQVRQTYAAILYRQRVVEMRRDAVRDLAHLADVAHKRFTAGEISEFESLQALSVLRSTEADLAQAEAELAQGEEGFCRMLYVDKPAGGMRLTGKTEPLEYQETIGAALSRARVERLDLRSAELQLEAVKLAQKAASGAFAPRVEAYVNYGFRSSYYDFGRQLDGWSVGALVRWDIFDSGQTIGAIRMQKADRRMAEIRLAETQRLVGSQVRELFASLEQSKIVIAAHASARDLGERSVREARQLYEVGRVSLEQVLNAELNYRQALLGWLGAVFTLNLTIYQLDYATANEAFLDSVAPGGP